MKLADYEKLREEILLRPVRENPHSRHTIHEAAKLQKHGVHYNFDDGYEGIYKILNDEYCDRSLALMFYWMNSPLFFLNNPEVDEKSIHRDGKQLKGFLEERIAGEYYPEILQFDPLEFIDKRMLDTDELVAKEAWLDEIPLGCFLPTGMEYSTTAIGGKLYPEFRQDRVERLYFIQPDSLFNKTLGQLSGENLRHLHIPGPLYYDPPAIDIGNLLHLNLLETLELDSRLKIKNLERLTEFPELKNLSLYFKSGDVGFLKEFPQLRSLETGSPDIANLDVIPELEKLEKLTLISCTALQSLEGLEKLENLRALSLISCQKLKNIDSVYKLPNLRKLEIRDLTLSQRSMKGIAGTQIEELRLSFRHLKSLDFLYSKDKVLLPSLKSLATDSFYKLDPVVVDQLKDLGPGCQVIREMFY